MEPDPVPTIDLRNVLRHRCFRPQPEEVPPDPGTDSESEARVVKCGKPGELVGVISEVR